LSIDEAGFDSARWNAQVIGARSASFSSHNGNYNGLVLKSTCKNAFQVMEGTSARQIHRVLRDGSRVDTLRRRVLA